MFIVIFLDVFAADIHARAGILANHFLREQVVADAALVFIPGKSLPLHGLLQILHAGEVVLLAHLIELLDYVRLDADAHILAALHQQLLIDLIAQQILLPLGVHRFLAIGSAGRTVVVDFLVELRLGFFVIRERDDLVVHARDDLFDHLSVALRLGLRMRRRWRGRGQRNAEQRPRDFLMPLLIRLPRLCIRFIPTIEF